MFVKSSIAAATLFLGLLCSAQAAAAERLAEKRSTGSHRTSLRSSADSPRSVFLRHSLGTEKIAAVLPNDPAFDLQWGLHNTGQTGGTADADIDAVEAWDLEIGRPEVIVAVLDTGVDYLHEDLIDNLWINENEVPDNGVDDDQNGYVDDYRGWDFYNQDNDPFDDGSGHGTHVSGVIGAVANNGIGISGINHHVRIMPLKFQSSGQVGRVDAAIEAIHYAVMMGASVMSNSWAVSSAWGETGHDQPGFSPELRAAIEMANAAGVLFVATAGNSGESKDEIPIYPAAYDNDNVIAVAATDADDRLAWWSNFGPTTVDLAAPGVSIYSTVPEVCKLRGVPPEGVAFCDGSRYMYASGTSMATPHVAGAAALIRARYPLASARQVKDRLLYSVDRLDDLQGKVVSHGRLNLARALEDDTLPPAGVTDLTLVGTTAGSLTLSWTAPGDDGGVGTPAAYEIRYSSAPLHAGNFETGQLVPPPVPQGAGSLESVTIAGLAPNTTYDIALVAIDNVGQRSILSNVVVATTGGLADEGLRALWRFDEGLGGSALDSSGSGNDLTLQGGSWAAGQIRGALRLDGSADHAFLADSALVGTIPSSSTDPAEAFTIAAWFRVASSGTRRPILVKQGSPHPEGRGFFLGVTDVDVVEFESWNGESRTVLFSSSVILPGNWHHVAVTQGDGTGRLYLDGHAESEQVGFETPQPNTIDLDVGRYFWSAQYTRHFEGELDEIAVWSRVLAPVEIEALHKNGLRGYGVGEDPPKCGRSGVVRSTTPATRGCYRARTNSAGIGRD